MHDARARSVRLHACRKHAKRTAQTCACARAHACASVCGVHEEGTAHGSDVCVCPCARMWACVRRSYGKYSEQLRRVRVRVCSGCKRDDTGSQTSEKLYNGSAPHHQSWTQHMRRWARMRALLFKTGKPNGQTCACACKPSESTGGSTHVDGLRCVLYAHKHARRTAQTCACPCEPLGTRRSTHTHNANNHYTVYECCTSDTPEDTFEKRNELQIQTNTCTQYAPMKTAAPFFLLPQTEAQIRDPRNGHRNLSQTWGV